ncbi:50S ribosomal protein L24 [Bienertia sinuspersici]
MPGLDIKYWGERILFKIIGQVGKGLKVDRATASRERLLYARVLIEIQIGQEFVVTITFQNENGKVMEQRVEYEWKPLVCTKCKGFGHVGADYRKGGKQQWDAKKANEGQ